MSPRILRFAAVGFSGVFINLGGLWLFADVFSLPDELSLSLAIEISIIWNFFLNNAWTFQDRNVQAEKSLGMRMARYNLVSLVGMGIQVGTFSLVKLAIQAQFDLQDIGIWKYFATCIGIGIATIWNFLSNFYWTWAQTSSPNSAEPELE